jgi:hypothetical protein
MRVAPRYCPMGIVDREFAWTRGELTTFGFLRATHPVWASHAADCSKRNDWAVLVSTILTLPGKLR